MSAINQHIAIAKEKGWLKHYFDAAAHYQIPVEILLAKDHRESWLGSLPGLIGRGWVGSDGISIGISQINKMQHPFAAKTDPNDVRAYVAKGAEILKAEIQRFPGNMKAALAAYNAGAGAVQSALDRGRDPDSVTTKGNYGADVLRRAAEIDGSTSIHSNNRIRKISVLVAPFAILTAYYYGQKHGYV